MQGEQRILHNEAHREHRQGTEQPAQRAARLRIGRAIQDLHQVRGVHESEYRNRHERQQHIAHDRALEREEPGAVAHRQPRCVRKDAPLHKDGDHRQRQHDPLTGDVFAGRGGAGEP